MNLAQQKSVYFPAWGKCAAANGWVMRRGRLAATINSQLSTLNCPPLADEQLSKVLKVAEELALQHHCAVTAEDIRHSCNWVATSNLPGGKPTFSSGPMTDAQMYRTIDLFELLRDPLDLKAIQYWMNPGMRHRDDYIKYLERTRHEAALIAIARNRWQTPEWRDRRIDELQWLARQTVPSRGRGNESASSRRRLQYDHTNDPY